MSLHGATEMVLILARAAMMSLIVSNIFRGNIVEYQLYAVLVSHKIIPFLGTCLPAEKRAERRCQ